MVLNDRDIIALGNAGFIDPFNSERVQPASIDLTLGNTFKLWSAPEVSMDAITQGIMGNDLNFVPAVDLDDIANSTKNMLTTFDLTDAQSLALEPGAFCLATTRERVIVKDDLVGRVEGKSSLGRLGLICHATAGFIDPGFGGTITLELFNMNPNPLVIRPGRAICQLSFMKLAGPARKPYGHADLNSHYQNQQTTTESRYEG
jgi:dCTP deaminase